MNSARTLAIGAILIGTLCVHGSAHADRMFCSVALESREGGILSVTTGIDLPLGSARLLPQITWRPPGSGKTAMFVIGYYGNPLTKLDLPSGGHVQFWVSAPESENEDDTAVTFALGENQEIRFPAESLSYGHDQAGQPIAVAAFIRNVEQGPPILAAIVEGQRITVTLVRNGKVLATESFDPSAVEPRDVLLARARTKVDALDPEVCTDVTRP